MNTKKLTYPYGLWMFIFIVVPLFMIVYYGFTVIDGTGVSFSLDNFARFFEGQYLTILGVSISLALKATLACLLLGYPLAYIIASESPKNRNILVFLLIIPMWMNFLLRTYAWLSLLGKNGIINSLLSMMGFSRLNLIYNDTAVLLGMVYNYLPFMVLPIYSVLIKIDKNLLEAAEDLGANRYKVFTRIILPLSIEGVITGITMVFMPAMSTFVISRLLGGGQYLLMGNLIEQQYLWVGDWNFGSAISIIMMIIIIVTMAATNTIGGRLGGYQDEK